MSTTINDTDKMAPVDDNNNATMQHKHGIRAEKEVTVEKSPEELYQFWHNFENLPQFMEHLESVTVTGPTTSHWVAKAPLGNKVEWDAEIINDIPNELIAWRSQEDADVPNAGSIRFKPSSMGTGTDVHVELQYNPPAGVVGAAVAKLFGEEPSMQIEDDLNRFKQFMETGAVTTK
jgi:uncharacterized membrane protein